MSKSTLIVRPKGSKFSNYFHAMLKRLGIVKGTHKTVQAKAHIKGRFGRMVLRNLVRNQVRYKPGKLGLSAVSKAIQNDYGRIMSRRERKQYAKTYRGFGSTFKAYYN